MSDEEEEDDGCDIFADSEKEEEDIEDIEENSRPVRKTVVAVSWQGLNWYLRLILFTVTYVVTVLFYIIFVFSFTLMKIVVELPKMLYKYHFLFQMLQFYKSDHLKYIHF